MDDISINIKLGKVSSLCGTMDFTLVVKSDMQGQIQVYCYNPTNMRKSGVLVQLDTTRFAELKQVIERAEQTMEKLKSSNQMTGLTTQKY